MAPDPGGDGTALVDSFAGEPAITLSAGPTELTVLPQVGLLGASLRHRGLEHLDLHGGADGARAGHTTGLPLLAPWANRLGSDTFRAAGRRVDLTAAPGLHRDGNGLAIHGTFVGRPGWTVQSVRTRPGSATMVAWFDAAADPQVMASFPFPFAISVALTVTPGRVEVATTLTASGRRAVPVSFGWHPYFRIPDVERDRLKVGLPARHRLVLDDRMLPTGEEVGEPAEMVSLAGRDRRLVLAGGRRRLTIAADKGYPYAQVYAPADHPFVALEPMTAPTDALSHDSTPTVQPGGRFTARFAVSFT